MAETHVGPSGLHLKKEITALKKAHCLRDPGTCSSWRSPLRSKPSAAAFGLAYRNGTMGNSDTVNSARRLPATPLRRVNRKKTVYLYNWGRHSCKSSDSGKQLDDDEQKLSAEGSPEDSLIDHHKQDSMSDTNLELPARAYGNRGTGLGTPVRRSGKKLKRSVIPKKRLNKHSEVSKLLDLPSSYIGDLDSAEPSDDTEYCQSDDLQTSRNEVAKKNGYFSQSASPLFSGSGCGNFPYSSKILRAARREGSSHSYTPASTSSYYKYGGRNPSTIGSWDGTAVSVEGDDLEQLDLPGRQGCGLPCWSKKSRGRGSGDFYSPSLSDILRKKGSSIFCGSQTSYNKKRPSSSYQRNHVPKSSQGLPLLKNSCDGGGSSADTVSDELSANIGELELEALSRLDGRRWSTCKSQDGLDLARCGEADSDVPENRSMSQKYRPRSFNDIVGQSIVVHSLNNAIVKGRIAPAYIFHGPRGTGKTSTARIFGATMNCLSTEQNKPCGFCRECTESHVTEVDATDMKGIDKVRHQLKHVSVALILSRYKVFVIDQCHMLSTKTWSTFMKFLEEPPSHVVFIFVTTDPERLSRAITSRCQKYLFAKVKDIDIIWRLRKLSTAENLDVDLDALNLIALNSDGSLRDAETMLEQLSLLGKRITSSLVNDLVGVVSDEKLLDLLEIAMSSDTAETVRISRELMDSGLDPMALMSQLAGLIMDIIAGTSEMASSQLTEAELERLQQALKILSEAEKQLRLSSERGTWFTAALLQLGSGHNTERARSSSSSKQSTRKMSGGAVMEEGTRCDPFLTLQETNPALIPRETSGKSSPHGCKSSFRVPKEMSSSEKLSGNSQSLLRKSLDVSHTDDIGSKNASKCVSPDKLAEIWKRCIEKCHSETLRQLLYAHGRILSIAEGEGVFIVAIAFADDYIKTRAERYLSSITNSIEIVLKHNVEVRICLVPESYSNEIKSLPDSPTSNHSGKVGFLSRRRSLEPDNLIGSSDKDRHMMGLNNPRNSLDYSEVMQRGTLVNYDGALVKHKGHKVASFPSVSLGGNNGVRGTIDKGQEISVPRTHTMIIDDERLESAWLQVSEKNTSGFASGSKQEKNQVVPQNVINPQSHNGSSISLAISSKQWDDELIHELQVLKNNDAQGYDNKQNGGHAEHVDISPSLLHSNSITGNSDKENQGYESGSASGCNGLLCWNTRKAHKEKETVAKPRKIGHLSLFGHRSKPKAPGSRLSK